METQANKSPHTLFWIAGIAVTLLSAAGIAAIMGWIPTSTSSPVENTMGLVQQPAAPGKPDAAQAQAQAHARDQARADAQERARDQARADARSIDRVKVVNGAIQSNA